MVGKPIKPTVFDPVDKTPPTKDEVAHVVRLGRLLDCVGKGNPLVLIHGHNRDVLGRRVTYQSREAFKNGDLVAIQMNLILQEVQRLLEMAGMAGTERVNFHAISDTINDMVRSIHPLLPYMTCMECVREAVSPPTCRCNGTQWLTHEEVTQAIKDGVEIDEQDRVGDQLESNQNFWDLQDAFRRDRHKCSIESPTPKPVYRDDEAEPRKAD